MPLVYSILPSLRLLCIRNVGFVTQAERIDTMRAWLADPLYGDCDDALCDFSQAQSTPTMAELRQLVGLMSQHLPGRGPSRVALVASTPITFVVAAEFRGFVEQAGMPLEVNVFSDFESAWEWLRPEEPPATSGDLHA